MVKEGVPLETVLILKGLLDVLFKAFGALVDTFADLCVTEEVQTAHGHFGELLGGIV